MIRYLGVREGGGVRVFTYHYPGFWLVRWAYADGPACVIERSPGGDDDLSHSVLCWN